MKAATAVETASHRSVRLRTPTIALALVALASSLLTGQTAHAVKKKAVYSTAAGGDAVRVCEGTAVEDGAPETNSPANIGGVCFSFGKRADTITIKIKDDINGENIGFYWEWAKKNGNSVPDPEGETDPVTGEDAVIWGSACSPVKRIPIPPKAREMRIWLDNAFGVLDCPDGLGFATTGTVIAIIK